jgi:hypothetical protein
MSALGFERTYDRAKPIRSAAGRAGGYGGAAEKHLQLLMGQAAWMTACKLVRMGACAMQLGCPLWAMCGRLRVGKNFLHVAAHWSVRPCVRPFSAVLMTAGHNALSADQVPIKSTHSTMRWHKWVVLTAGSTGALHYVLFALPTFTSRRMSGAILFRPPARSVPCSVHLWSSWPTPSARVCWQARWRRPWLAGGPATP